MSTAAARRGVRGKPAAAPPPQFDQTGASVSPSPTQPSFPRDVKETTPALSTDLPQSIPNSEELARRERVRKLMEVQAALQRELQAETAALGKTASTSTSTSTSTSSSSLNPSAITSKEPGRLDFQIQPRPSPETVTGVHALQPDISKLKSAGQFTSTSPDLVLSGNSVRALLEFAASKEEWGKKPIPWGWVFSMDPLTQQFVSLVSQQLWTSGAKLSTPIAKKVLAQVLDIESNLRFGVPSSKLTLSALTEKTLGGGQGEALRRDRDGTDKNISFLDLLYVSPFFTALKTFVNNRMSFEERKRLKSRTLPGAPTPEQLESLLNLATNNLRRAFSPFSDFAFFLLARMLQIGVVESGEGGGDSGERQLRRFVWTFHNMIVPSPFEVQALYNVTAVHYVRPLFSEQRTTKTRYHLGALDIFILSPAFETEQTRSLCSRFAPFSLETRNPKMDIPTISGKPVTPIADPLAWLLALQRTYPGIHFTTFVPEDNLQRSGFSSSGSASTSSSFSSSSGSRDSSKYTWSWAEACKSGGGISGSSGDKIQYCASSPNALIWKFEYGPLVRTPLIALAEKLSSLRAGESTSRGTGSAEWAWIEKQIREGAPKNYGAWAASIESMYESYRSGIVRVASHATSPIDIPKLYLVEMKLDFPTGEQQDSYEALLAVNIEAGRYTSKKTSGWRSWIGGAEVNKEAMVNELLRFIQGSQFWEDVRATPQKGFVLLAKHLNALVEPIIAMYLHYQLAVYLGSTITPSVRSTFADEKFTLSNLFPEDRVFVFWGPEFILSRYYAALVKAEAITSLTAATGWLGSISILGKGSSFTGTCVSPWGHESLRGVQTLLNEIASGKRESEGIS